MTTQTFRLEPIEGVVADRLRGLDAKTYTADQTPGYPCRHCLRDAEVGEELVLVSYDPFTADTPYRSASPIFLHRDRCEPPTDLSALPDQLIIRQLSVRAFDSREMMIDAAVVDGHELGETIERLFDNEASQLIHVHNATRGCWAVTAVRA